MIKKKYKVVNPIEGFETNAEIGDVVYLGWWDGSRTIMKDGKALCDEGSPLHKQCCEAIEE